jgi:hypothetical protein
MRSNWSGLSTPTHTDAAMERSAPRTSDVRCRRSGSTRRSTHALNATDESFGPTPNKSDVEACPYSVEQFRGGRSERLKVLIMKLALGTEKLALGESPKQILEAPGDGS